ncbi:helix-turn-helix domain-containing protein [Cutibacterium porci]|nr:helix-turn-helix transcriptional regulator [Cutibacterium porci]
MTDTHNPRGAAAAEVRAAVAKAGVSYQDLAQWVGISPTVLARKLNGSSPLGVEELISIARVLDIRPSDLIHAATIAAAA